MARPNHPGIIMFEAFSWEHASGTFVGKNAKGTPKSGGRGARACGHAHCWGPRLFEFYMFAIWRNALWSEWPSVLLIMSCSKII